METTEKNIRNLTTLWQTACQPFHTFVEKDGFAYASIPESQWPNRIWLTKKTTKEILDELVKTMQESAFPLTFSYFDETMMANTPILSPFGLTEKSIQYGMSLNPVKSFPEPDTLQFQRVKNAEMAREWSLAFQQAFAYFISPETLLNSPETIHYYNIRFQEQMAGTLLLFKTGNTLGIHALGILPVWRGKGFARQAMHFVLNHAHKTEVNQVSLQASEMAKSLYESLGFSTQFIMKNYQL